MFKILKRLVMVALLLLLLRFSLAAAWSLDYVMWAVFDGVPSGMTTQEIACAGGDWVDNVARAVRLPYEDVENAQKAYHNTYCR